MTGGPGNFGAGTAADTLGSRRAGGPGVPETVSDFDRGLIYRHRPGDLGEVHRGRPQAPGRRGPDPPPIDSQSVIRPSRIRRCHQDRGCGAFALTHRGTQTVQMTVLVR
eukprot:254859-Hanusia_phi.AAC.1